jgi:hypothetical protein
MIRKLLFIAALFVAVSNGFAAESPEKGPLYATLKTSMAMW